AGPGVQELVLIPLLHAGRKVDRGMGRGRLAVAVVPAVPRPVAAVALQLHDGDGFGGAVGDIVELGGPIAAGKNAVHVPRAGARPVVPTAGVRRNRRVAEIALVERGRVWRGRNPETRVGA